MVFSQEIDEDSLKLNSTKDSLNVYINGQIWLVSNPEKNQKAASEVAPMVTNGSFETVEGCVVGIFSQEVGREFLTLIKTLKIKHHYISASGRYFSIAPSSGEDVSAFYRRVLPVLRRQRWVESAGPFLYSYSNSGDSLLHQNFMGRFRHDICYLKGSIYLQVQLGIDATALEALMNKPGITKVSRPTDRVGFIVDLDEAMGLDIIRLGEEWAKETYVQKVDVHIECLLLGDMRDNR